MDYLIAATPRVGSNLLASLLFGTGVIGNPREYLCPTELGAYGPKIQRDPSEFGRYYEACREENSTNGSFGLKVHYAQMQWAAQHGFDLKKFFPDRIIYLTRADKLGQAISHVRAMQTGAWISMKEERATPQFEAERIYGALRRIVDENHAWESFFRHHDVEPMRIGYESLCEDFQGETKRMLEFLDVDPSEVDVEKVVTNSLGYFKKQRDTTNDDWRARYCDWLRRRAATGASKRASDRRHAS